MAEEESVTFLNVVPGTGEWSDWITPAVGAENATFIYKNVLLKEPIKETDSVFKSVEIEFDNLDLTESGASFGFQGATRKDADDAGTWTWHYFNPVASDLQSFRGKTFSGIYKISGVSDVSLGRYDDESSDGYNKSPVGRRYFQFGVRVNNSRGGRYRLRRLMVVLNGTAAWAPAEGEEIAGGGVAHER